MTSNQDEQTVKKGVCARLLAGVGIKCTGERDRWVVLTRRFPFVVLGCFVVGLLGFGGFVHYTGTSEFCNDCHYIEPYYQSWKTSSHHEVGCLKCHYPPGAFNYVRGKVMGLSELVKTITADQAPKPHAEVEDAACLRGGCHEERLLHGKVTFKEKYHFDHKPHLTELRRGKELRCTSCHSQIVQGAHMTVTESVCFTCHFKDKVSMRHAEPVGGCTACHDTPTEEIELEDGGTFGHQMAREKGVECTKCHLDSVQGQGDVPKQVCRDCHGEPEKVEHYDDSQHLHDWHVTKRKVECFQCHQEIRHGLQPEPYQTPFSCRRCHQGDHFPEEDLFSGRGGRGVEDNPGKHATRHLDCVACHENLADGGAHGVKDVGTFAADKSVCADCHDPGTGMMVTMWKQSLTQTLSDTEKLLTEVQKGLEAADLPDSDAREYKALVEDAWHNYEFVKRANGVHNPGYAFSLLQKATEWGEQVQEDLQTRQDEERGEGGNPNEE